MELQAAVDVLAIQTPAGDAALGGGLLMVHLQHAGQGGVVHAAIQGPDQHATFQAGDTI